ncbi:MAG: OmpA family protein [Alphaproteobacteria bacterium]|nr:OmpA family protein [Alphaproteobacteria bacterium]
MKKIKIIFTVLFAIAVAMPVYVYAAAESDKDAGNPMMTPSFQQRADMNAVTEASRDETGQSDTMGAVTNLAANQMPSGEATSGGAKGFFNRAGNSIGNWFGKMKTNRETRQVNRKAEREKDVAAEDVAEEKKGTKKEVRAEAKAKAATAFTEFEAAVAEAEGDFDDAALDDLNAAEKVYRETIAALIKQYKEPAKLTDKQIRQVNTDMEAHIMEANHGVSNASPEELKELRDNSRKMKQQDGLSRLTTAVSTTAMGIGGMQLAQGLSERGADREALAEMESLLADFECGESRSQGGIRGSLVNPVKINLTEEISVGGTDTDFINLELAREEYMNLAAQIKADKEALGMPPGIESEVVLDTSSLYQNQGRGTIGGTSQARLSMALLDENGRDAAAINALRQQAQNRITGGAIAVAGGAAVAIVGQTLINKKGAPERSADIRRDHAAAANDLTNAQKRREQTIRPADESGERTERNPNASKTPTVVTTPTSTTTTTTNNQTEQKNESPEAPPKEEEANNSEITIPDFEIERDTSCDDGKCDEPSQVNQPQASSPNIDKEVENAKEEVVQVQEQAKEKTPQSAAQIINKNLCDLPRVCNKGRAAVGGTLFAFDSFTITPAGKTAIKNLADDIRKIQQELPGQSIQIFVTGYTDSIGSDAVNDRLSRQRAGAVTNELILNNDIPADIVSEPVGMGKKNPVCPANNTKECRQQNRRVEIQVSASGESESGTPSFSDIGSNVSGLNVIPGSK